MHEPKASYEPKTVITASECATLKHAARFIADRVTYSQSRTFVQPLANPVDPVLTAFDWISAYYTVLASQLEAVFVCQSS